MATTAASIALLRVVADAVERLGEARVRNLLQSALTNNAAATKQSSRPSRKTAAFKSSPVVRQQLIDQSLKDLEAAHTREEALDNINQADLNRKEVERLARAVDVPVRKDQSIRDLTELVVNVTVGARLNSAAIRKGS